MGCLLLLLFFLVVKHTVAIAFKIGVGNLLLEFGADAFCIIAFFKPAGTVAALLFKTFFYFVNNLLVIVESYLWHFSFSLNFRIKYSSCPQLYSIVTLTSIKMTDILNNSSKNITYIT